jgi:hypothetical protein
MPGTLIQDALASNLASGATLNAAGTTNGTVVELPWSQEIQLKLVTGTVTGTTPTLNVEIQSSSTSDFSADVVSHGRFAQVGDEDNETRYLTIYHDKRYIRAVVVIAGTSPVYTGTTITPVLPHDLRSSTTSA